MRRARPESPSPSARAASLFARLPRLLSVAAAAAVAVATFALLPACRREATEADCELIVDRLIEVELHAMNTNDPAVIAKKQETIRSGMKEELKDCRGRRITDGIMACVKKAPTTDEILACIK